MSCGITQNKNALSENILKKINNHPCYSQNAHQHYARIHVAIAPACNIQCDYCNRKYDCSNESRPGVTSCRLTPEEAVKKVLYVGGIVKQMSVVGIAGPGDALANPKQTFETFRLLKKYAPDIKLCLSTNGLNIEKYIDEITKYNIEHITVTLNTVDESGEIGSKIYSWVYHEGKRYAGAQGAKLLLSKQLRGIKMLVDRGILVKVNAVLIPNINEDELPKVAKKVKELGVFIFNVMPLISKPEHGTKFALNGVKSASHKLLMSVQEACEVDVKLMRHCRQCRADAVGLLGEDRGDEFFKKDFADKSYEELLNHYDTRGRADTHEKIEKWRDTLSKANERALQEEAGKRELSSIGETKLVAVTSRSDGLINEHFGSAKEFLIYEAGDRAIRFITHRKVETSYCKGPDGCGTYVIDEIKKALTDCDILLTQKIGDCPRKELEHIALICDESFADEPIEISVLKAARKYFSFEKLKVC
ncbi:MAG: nitrogenase cofactor biosynthesis protein NifB [Campylobacteraceae bacterium]|jgi:nitrogen fixation protein NifB|nr:nitrogenase cofactor biosynthesis protein NifB [Campylobacteraceae bacterium]